MAKYFCLLIWVAATLLTVSCGSELDLAGGSETHHLDIGSPVPELSLPALDGGQLELDSPDFHGKTVVLNFWATWCAPCRQEIPELIALSELDGLEVVGISLDQELERIRPFMEEHGISYRIALGDQEIFERFQGYAIPYTLVVAPDRRIQEVIRGPIRSSMVPALSRRADGVGLGSTTAGSS